LLFVLDSIEVRDEAVGVSPTREAIFSPSALVKFSLFRGIVVYGPVLYQMMTWGGE